MSVGTFYGCSDGTATVVVGSNESDGLALEVHLMDATDGLAEMVLVDQRRLDSDVELDWKIDDASRSILCPEVNSCVFSVVELGGKCYASDFVDCSDGEVCTLDWCDSGQ